MSEGVRTSALAHPSGAEARNRYEVLAEIGAGGMASVDYARLRGAHGFVRNVAIKRLHPQFAKDPEFVKMFLDEARLCARLAHANIVSTVDVIDHPHGIGIVMEYVHGESLSGLLELAQVRATPVPIHVATALMASVLHGLHAAHETLNDDGAPLGIVHRDVSPHNILVGADGIPRVIDFGIAKAIGKSHVTPSGELKGKLMYMAPEQLDGSEVDRRADIYGAAAVLWETLCGASLHDAATESAVVHSVLHGRIEPPSKQRPEVPEVLDGIVLRGLQRDRTARYASAREMALTLERDVGIASQSELATWLHELAADRLETRARLIAQWHEQGATRAPMQLPAAGLPPEAPRATRARTPTVLLPADASVLRQRQQSTRTELRRFWAFGSAVLVLLGAAVALWILRHSPRPAAPSQVEAAQQLRPRAASAAAAEPAPQSSESMTSAATASPSVEQAREATSTHLPSANDRMASPTEPTASDAPAAHSAAPRDPASVQPVAQPARAAKRERPRSQRSVPPKPATESPRQAGPSAAQGCKPWYYIDEAGIRRPKPGCL